MHHGLQLKEKSIVGWESQLDPLCTVSSFHHNLSLLLGDDSGSIHVLNNLDFVNSTNSTTHKILSQQGFISSHRLHGESIESLVLSNDDSLLISTSCDHRARLWNTHDFSLISSFEAHHGIVKSASFSPTSSHIIATTGLDGGLCLWDSRLCHHRSMTSLDRVSSFSLQVTNLSSLSPRRHLVSSRNTCVGFINSSLVVSSTDSGLLELFDIRFTKSNTSKGKITSSGLISTNQNSPAAKFSSCPILSDPFVSAFPSGIASFYVVPCSGKVLVLVIGRGVYEFNLISTNPYFNLIYSCPVNICSRISASKLANNSYFISINSETLVSFFIYNISSGVTEAGQFNPASSVIGLSNIHLIPNRLSMIHSNFSLGFYSASTCVVDESNDSECCVMETRSPTASVLFPSPPRIVSPLTSPRESTRITSPPRTQKFKQTSISNFFNRK
ncbi:hypothetical protein RCL1_004290 [Eukaryota sp. TZLM3-RCL]